MPHPLLLASQSPRRKTILSFFGVPFRVVLPLHGPEKPLLGETPRAFVRRMALEKAHSIARKFPAQWVIGADTVVVQGRRIIGKPKDRREARRTLVSLRGKTHRVLTGVALAGKGGRFEESHVEETRVTFKNFPLAELERYLRSREPYDKAGGYDIRGVARFWVKGWEGDFFNVMGLPLQWLVGQLNTHVFYSPERRKKT